MAKTRSMTRNQNHDDAPSWKRIKNHDDARSRKRIKNHDDACSRNVVEGVGVPWSDIDHDVLLLVMMRLGVIDFLAFSGVCKAWRLVALPNRKRFMASRPPMSIHISIAYKKTCYLEDFEGRRFKTVIPRVYNKTCVGLTCGYLILFGRKTRDFWLVNPITRHQLHFPAFPHDVHYDFHDPPLYLSFKTILVFSPSTSGWLFAITQKFHDQIWFSHAGKGVWNHVSSTTSKILDLCAFKGKIYALDLDGKRDVQRLCEIKLGPEPKFMELETKIYPSNVAFVSSSEKLFVKKTFFYKNLVQVQQLDFDEMKWVFCEKTMEEYEFYSNYCMNHITAVKREYSWWAGTDKIQTPKSFFKWMWNFPHECLNVNLIDE